MSDFLIIWVALCTLLVLLMQAGFTCFEAGTVRRKNSTNVALKNAADVGLCVVVFMAVGYPLLFGSDQPIVSGWIGWGQSPLLTDDSLLMMKALFQSMFAGTAITIISGAISERTSFRGYLLITFFTSLFIYPISGHWVWAENGWLNEMGFYDFAGGTVVHVVGGTIGLATILHIGPRIGRFNSQTGIEPSNLSFATLGMLILFFGWFGFNAGGAISLKEDVPLILVNTALGATSGLFAIIILVLIGKTRPKSDYILCAPLGGLVAITPGCAVLPPLGAMSIGIIGAFVAIMGLKALERLKLDDPVGAIPVHMFAGIIGTILIPFFVFQDKIPEIFASRLDWFFVQFLGVAAISLFAFVMSYAFISLSKTFIAYRVSEKDEMIGLNISEHDANTAMYDLIKQMADQGQKGEFSRPVVAEPETDAGYIAYFYNQVRDRFLNETNRSQALLEEANHLAHHDPLTGLYNRRAFNEAAHRKLADFKRYGTACAIILLDVDFFKKINDQYGHDIGDEVLVELSKRLKSTARDNDIVARIGGEEFAILITLDVQEKVTVPAERYRLAIENADIKTMVGPIKVTASLGVVVIDEKMTLNKALKIGDQALYRAKKDGRNCVRIGSLQEDEQEIA